MQPEFQEESSDERWAEIVSIQEGLDYASVPPSVSRIDGKPRVASRKATRLAEAMAFSDRWSGITDARQRREARYGDLAA